LYSDKISLREIRKTPIPKRLRLEMLKNAEKFLSIAGAINCKFLHILYSFLSLSKS
jgi:hypothetical protein